MLLHKFTSKMPLVMFTCFLLSTTRISLHIKIDVERTVCEFGGSYMMELWSLCRHDSTRSGEVVSFVNCSSTYCTPTQNYKWLTNELQVSCWTLGRNMLKFFLKSIMYKEGAWHSSFHCLTEASVHI